MHWGQFLTRNLLLYNPAEKDLRFDSHPRDIMRVSFQMHFLIAPSELFQVALTSALL